MFGSPGSSRFARDDLAPERGGVGHGQRAQRLVDARRVDAGAGVGGVVEPLAEVVVEEIFVLRLRRDEGVGQGIGVPTAARAFLAGLGHVEANAQGVGHG